MAPRRRRPGFDNWPTGLSKVPHRGQLRLRFRYPNGQDFWFPVGTADVEAIQAARIINEELRAPVQLQAKKLDKYNRPIKEWLPKVIARVKSDEKLSHQVMKTFLSNCDKLIATHGNVLSKEITLATVNDFIDAHAAGKSNEVQNRKVSFLNKVFDYMVDMSAMETNPARAKKARPIADKVRQRLKLETFQTIYANAPTYLKVAMGLALQTTHAVLEVSRIKYSHCDMLKIPEVLDGVTVYGYLRIHRQKVKKKEASRVEIPITQAIKDIIDLSRSDKVLSPYLVHRISRGNKIATTVNHPTQCTTDYISKAFSSLRDELKLCEDLSMDERPTFHEIRALAIHLYDKAGYDPQARAAHTDARSTKVYKENHVEWVRVPVGELKIS